MLSAMVSRRLPLVALLGLSLVAIAGCQPKPSDIPGPEQSWKQMGHEQRQVYMAQAVLSRWHFRREHMKPHPETVRFMWEQVEPQMSALLGGPKGVRGFNCRSCHVLR